LTPTRRCSKLTGAKILAASSVDGCDSSTKIA
jgi:hypothetical protein